MKKAKRRVDRQHGLVLLDARLAGLPGLHRRQGRRWYGMTRGLARKLGQHNIRINSIAPGWIMTERQQMICG